VLVVDDEPNVCHMVARLLYDAGFDVCTATSGRQALAMLPDAIDVVVLDVRLPGLNGPEIARLARQDGTTAPVLFMSGFPEPPTGDAGTAEQLPGEYLAKPFSQDQLVSAVRRLLRAS
jgi:two-component system OmpR family response regulator